MIVRPVRLGAPGCLAGLAIKNRVATRPETMKHRANEGSAASHGTLVWHPWIPRGDPGDSPTTRSGRLPVLLPPSEKAWKHDAADQTGRRGQAVDTSSQAPTPEPSVRSICTIDRLSATFVPSMDPNRHLAGGRTATVPCLRSARLPLLITIVIYPVARVQIPSALRHVNSHASGGEFSISQGKLHDS